MCQQHSLRRHCAICDLPIWDNPLQVFTIYCEDGNGVDGEDGETCDNVIAEPIIMHTRPPGANCFNCLERRVRATEAAATAAGPHMQLLYQTSLNDVLRGAVAESRWRILDRDQEGRQLEDWWTAQAEGRVWQLPDPAEVPGGLAMEEGGDGHATADVAQLNGTNDHEDQGFEGGPVGQNGTGQRIVVVSSDSDVDDDEIDHGRVPDNYYDGRNPRNSPFDGGYGRGTGTNGTNGTNGFH